MNQLLKRLERYWKGSKSIYLDGPVGTSGWEYLRRIHKARIRYPNQKGLGRHWIQRNQWWIFDERGLELTAWRYQRRGSTRFLSDGSVNGPGSWKHSRRFARFERYPQRILCYLKSIQTMDPWRVDQCGSNIEGGSTRNIYIYIYSGIIQIQNVLEGVERYPKGSKRLKGM